METIEQARRFRSREGSKGVVRLEQAVFQDVLLLLLVVSAAEMR